MTPAVVILPPPMLEPTLAGAERQTRPPAEVFVAESEETLRETLDAAAEHDPRWIWLLDGGVVPEPDALERLLIAAQSATPAPVLVTSKLVTRAGALDRDSLPVPEVHQGERVVGALEHRAVPLRTARLGSMLIRHDEVRRIASRSRLDRDLEWSAELLRREPGLLVPASVAVRLRSRPRPPGAELAGSLGLLRALEPRERLWFAAHLGERVLRARPGGVRRAAPG